MRRLRPQYDPEKKELKDVIEDEEAKPEKDDRVIKYLERRYGRRKTASTFASRHLLEKVKGQMKSQQLSKSPLNDLKMKLKSQQMDTSYFQSQES